MRHGKNYSNNSKNTDSNMDTVVYLSSGLKTVSFQGGCLTKGKQERKTN